MVERFEAGQIWSMLGRPKDGDAHLLILAVTGEPSREPIYSVAVTGVKIKNPSCEGGVQDVLPHAPVSEKVLGDAAIDLVARDGPTADHPDHADAYRQWQQSCEDGDAGVFTIPIVEILDLVEQVVSSVEPIRLN